MKPLTKAIHSAHRRKTVDEPFVRLTPQLQNNPPCDHQAPSCNTTVEQKHSQQTSSNNPHSVKDRQVRERDRKEKDKMKKNADTRRRASPSDLKAGDKILVRQRRQNKFSRTSYIPGAVKYLVTLLQEHFNCNCKSSGGAHACHTIKCTCHYYTHRQTSNTKTACMYKSNILHLLQKCSNLNPIYTQDMHAHRGLFTYIKNN